MSLPRVLLLCAALAACADARAVLAPEIQIDLDLPAAARWAPAIAHCGGAAAGNVISKYIGDATKKLPPAVTALIEHVAGDIDTVGITMPKELREEMKALAHGLDVSLGQLVLLNFLYPLRSLSGALMNTTGPVPAAAQRTGGACTSIIATEGGSKRPLHVRNMDWNLPLDARERTTFKCNFVKGGAPVFSGACYIGFVGLISGMVVKEGAGWGVTLNEREHGGNILVDLVNGLFEGGWEPTHLLRQTLATQADYAGAVAALSTTRLCAPAYFIVSGPQPLEGTVLTRERKTLYMQRSLSDATAPHWVGQTNYDWDKDVPSYDNRRGYLIDYMTALAPEAITNQTMFDVISKWPVLNEHSAYTTVMQPATGTFQLFTRI